MPTYAKLCVYAAYACAAAIVAVPFAARWLYPLQPVSKPQGLGDVITLIGDAVSAAGRGAWALSLVSGLVVSVILLVIVAYLGARGTGAERQTCLLPLLACLAAVIACAVIDAWLGEFHS